MDLIDICNAYPHKLQPSGCTNNVRCEKFVAALPQRGIVKLKIQLCCTSTQTGKTCRGQNWDDNPTETQKNEKAKHFLAGHRINSAISCARRVTLHRTEMTRRLNIAVIIPAYNEEQTIGEVMMDFHHVVPDALIVVVDNNSTDSTYKRAKDTAARMQQGSCMILCESRRGKAAAVKRAFHDVDADVYVMVDADCTYPAHDLPSLLQPIIDESADVVIGNRHADGAYGKENKRRFHSWGNQIVRDFINILFHGKLIDILSGYRVMTRDFVKNYPILSNGFAIETEMSIHILDKGYRVVELPTHYVDRPTGSISKLNTVSDGIRIILLIFNIFINFRPMLFFSATALVLITCGLIAGAVPVLEFVKTAFVSHFPLAILAVGLVLSGCLSFFVGIILSNSYRNHRFLYEHLKLNNNC